MKSEIAIMSGYGNRNGSCRLSDMSDLQNVWKETDSSVLMKVDGKFAARTPRVHNACITLGIRC